MLCEKIKSHLDNNGISYSFVATNIGVSPQVFSALINGKRKITVEEYFSICNVLKVDVSYFISKMTA